MKQVFINLPVTDMHAAVRFYTALGFLPYPLFTFEDQTSLAWGDQILLMLQSPAMVTRNKLKTVADPQQHFTASFTLPLDSMETLSRTMAAAIEAGGKAYWPPTQESYMQVRNLEDPDGHLWALIHLDLEQFRAATNR